MSNENPPEKSDAPEENTKAVSMSSSERLVADWQKRPRFYLTLLLAFGVVVLGWFLYGDYKASEKQEFRAGYYEQLQALRDLSPSQQVESLEGIVSTYQGTEMEATSLWALENTLSFAAQRENDPAQKLKFMQRQISLLDKLAEVQRGTPLEAMPWTAKLEDGTPQPSVIEGKLAYVREQVAWLEEQASGVTYSEDPDPDLVANLVLAADDGSEYPIKIRFFSQRAPLAVHNFLEMAKAGHWKDTQAFALAMTGAADSPEVSAIHIGSYFSKVAPDRPEIMGSELDFIGFTLPLEKSGLEAKPGRIAYRVREESNQSVGSNPMEFSILTKEGGFVPNAVVFAEIEAPEGKQVEDLIGELIDQLPIDPPTEGDTTAPTPKMLKRPTSMLKVKSLTIEGTPVEQPGWVPARKWSLPEVPAKPAVEESTGGETGTGEGVTPPGEAAPGSGG